MHVLYEYVNDYKELLISTYFVSFDSGALKAVFIIFLMMLVKQTFQVLRK
jgi:hypothetical protein